MRHSEIYKLNGWDQVNKILPNLREIDAYENKFNCKDFPNIIEVWKKMNLSVIELDEVGETDYVHDSCIDDETHEKFHSVHESSDVGVVWYIIGFLTMFAAGVAIVFAMRKFDIVNKMTNIVKTRSNQPSELLTEEEV